MNTIYTTLYRTDLTALWLAASDRGVCGIGFERVQTLEAFLSAWPQSTIQNGDNDIIRRVVGCLDAYFAGKPEAFDLPLDLSGTPFQQAVWAAVRRIPYGKLRTYAQIAVEIGAPGAVRAVGGANRANPMPFVVPCHRVVRCGGGLGGYAGGLEVKDALLRLEGAII